MSALAMILAAGMAVGNGPEKVSGEMEERLNLSGEWEGELYHACGTSFTVSYQGGTLIATNGEQVETMHVQFIDEGNGKLRGTEKGKGDALGIYKWERQSLILCIGLSGRPRPSSFQQDDEHSLLILRRVKARQMTPARRLSLQKTEFRCKWGFRCKAPTHPRCNECTSFSSFRFGLSDDG
jgi:hypothetical protein